MGSAHRALLLVVAAVAVAAVAGVVVLWPASQVVDEAPEAALGDTEIVDARLLEVRTVEEAAADDATMPAGASTVEITAELVDTGERVVFEMVDETGDTYQPGQGVELARLENEAGDPTWLVNDFRRGGALLVLAGFFVVAVLAFGRLQGLRALVGLAGTLLVVIGFVVPAILDGSSPVAVALSGGTIIMIATLYLAHGFGPKTTVAVVGTAGALVVTVVLAWAFVEAATLTGFASEEARLANVQVGGLSLRGLLLAGIIIGGLGVLDDVTMSQSATVFALYSADPRAGFARLTGMALSVGRDHVAATVNTLFLAYAGAALPLLILFTTGSAPPADVLTAEIVAVEIVRTLVGSLGLIAAVPLTTALAALAALQQSPDEPVETEGERPAPPDVEPDRGGDDDWIQRLRDAYRLDPRDGGRGG